MPACRAGPGARARQRCRDRSSRRDPCWPRPRLSGGIGPAAPSPGRAVGNGLVSGTGLPPGTGQPLGTGRPRGTGQPRGNGPASGKGAGGAQRTNGSRLARRGPAPPVEEPQPTAGPKPGWNSRATSRRPGVRSLGRRRRSGPREGRRRIGSSWSEPGRAVRGLRSVGQVATTAARAASAAWARLGARWAGVRSGTGTCAAGVLPLLGLQDAKPGWAMLATDQRRGRLRRGRLARWPAALATGRRP